MRPLPTARVRPALSELGWALLALFFAELAFVLVTPGRALPELASGQLWLLFGPARTALAAALYSVLARASSNAIDAPVRSEPRPGAMATTMLVAGHIVLASGGAALIAAVLELLGQPVTEQEALTKVIDQVMGEGLGWTAIILVGSAVVAAPIAEELYFRYLLFRRTLHRTGLGLAYAVSALPFALVHMNLTGFLVYTWLGLVFASAYLRTGRLWCAILVHAANNSAALALYFLFDDPPI